MNLKEYKHIIWDWNRTLINDVDLCIRITNNMLNQRGKPTINIDIYKNIFGFPVRDYYEKVGFDFSKESFESLANEFIREYDKNKLDCSLHEGVENLLKKCNDIGITHSILSASNINGLINTVSHYKINEYFLGTNGLSNNFAQSKVEVGKRWISSLTFNKEDILLIGDTLHDYEVAKELDIDCILISKGHQSEEVLKTSTFNVIESISSILKKQKNETLGEVSFQKEMFRKNLLILFSMFYSLRGINFLYFLLN